MLFCVGAALIWAASITVYKRYGGGIAAPTLNLFKTLVALTGLVSLVVILRPPFPHSQSVWLGLAVSGLIGLGMGDTFFFLALSRLPAGLTTLMQCLAPPLAATFAAIFLGERLGGRQIAGMAITLVSLATVVAEPLLRRHQGVAPLGVLFAALAALCESVSLVCARGAFREADVYSGTFLRFVPAALALSLVFARQRGPMPRGKRVVPLTIAALAGNFLGILLMSAGLKATETGVASTLFATYPLWALPLGRIFLGESWRAINVVCTLTALGGIALMSSR